MRVGAEGPLWRPSAERVAGARLTAFTAFLADAHHGPFPSYADLQRFSIDQRDVFWEAVWRFCGVLGKQADGHRAARILVGDAMPGARYFPDATLNFAENLLRRRGPEDAVVFLREDGDPRRLSAAELFAEVSKIAALLREWGIRPGDRVAGYLPNIPEAIVAALAAASIGAVWSSCSPDFGVQGILDRFGQIEPRVLFAADGYLYGGKQHDCLARVRDVVARIPSVERVVIVPFVSDAPVLDGIPGVLNWDDATADEGCAIAFEPLPFNHPLYILYSSGTTGVPKCIVHGAGGTLLQHLKEHQLHCDIRPDDRVFYFTTCGWMMWNWLVTALASEAALLLFDGSPFHPDGSTLFSYAAAERMTLFGTSAKFIDAVAKAGLKPGETHDLSTVRTLTSTGSPLSPESFDFVYRDIKPDIHLASISGGTDIVSCFVGGIPTAPVWRGEIQAKALGMAVAVFDPAGRRIVGQKGELVCTRSFPSMPVGFWNDPGGQRYRAAYFEHYPGVWRHGDWVEETDRGGFVIYGRSDATLNPGGVRIGTAEIYRQVEQLDDILESLVIGQQWQGDERIVLFVRLRPGAVLDPALEARVRAALRQNTSPRHVPAKIVQVDDIPRTKSGKIVELAVRAIVHGDPVPNLEALANPAALDHFRDRMELTT
ncbi:MAG: acetoacetate--CoA ligase [Vicinamibacterales bacterium]